MRMRALLFEIQDVVNVVNSRKCFLKKALYRVRTSPGKPGKSWKFQISKSRPGKPGKYVLVLESPGKLDFSRLGQ